MWLADAQPNCAACAHTTTTLGEQYFRDIEAYSDSVVTTSPPLDIAESACQYCGHSYADLELLPIPINVDCTSTHSIANKPQQNYLLVSRVTSRHALLALSPFTSKLAEWSKPPANALDEEKRLNLLSDLTLATMSSATGGPTGPQHSSSSVATHSRPPTLQCLPAKHRSVGAAARIFARVRCNPM